HHTSIEAMLGCENTARCDPPLPADELRELVHQVIYQIDRPEWRRPSQTPPRGRWEEAMDVAAEGQHLATTGVSYVVDGLVPAYGMLGMTVAYTKVGKTTFSVAL